VIDQTPKQKTLDRSVCTSPASVICPTDLPLLLQGYRFDFGDNAAAGVGQKRSDHIRRQSPA